MEKSRIKQLVRESLNKVAVAEAEVNEEKIKDYSDVKTAMSKNLAPSEVDVLKAIEGSGADDKSGTGRSLFNKKLHQKKNDKGSTYQFDDEELDKVRTALKIK